MLTEGNQGSQKHMMDIVIIIFNFEYICRWSTLKFYKILTAVNSNNKRYKKLIYC